jgi:DNA primase
MRSRVADFQRQAAPEVQSRDEAWFLNQLQRSCPEVHQKGKDFIIRCPFHADNNPNCGVDRYTGIFHCFACGAGGGWNKLAHRLELEKLSYKHDTHLTESDMTSSVSRALTKIGVRLSRHAGQDLSRPLVEEWAINRTWRSLSGAFLAKVGCIRVLDLKNNVERIGLPVRTPEGALMGYTCRALDPEDAEPKYTPLSPDRLNWREKELPAISALFLIDRVLDEGWDCIVLVEGPADALRLYAAGIPAVAILGTNNWSDIKASILMGLGFRKIFVMMDNDRSGHDAQATILADLAQSADVKGLKLPTRVKDPDKLTDKQVLWVKTASLLGLLVSSSALVSISICLLTSCSSAT